MATIHIRPTAELAPRVLLPGDPGRALALAQEHIHKPKMFNHNRGLWGYTGVAKADRQPLTIQSTGIGGPSAAIVLHELIQLGARTVVRVGTCGALAPSLSLGELVVARRSIAADGVGRRLARNAAARDDELILDADLALTRALEAAAHPAAAGTIVTTDIFYEPRGSRREQRWIDAGALAVEMETAALLAVGAQQRVAVGSVLAVSDVLHANRRHRIEDEPLREAGLRLGAVAISALGSVL